MISKLLKMNNKTISNLELLSLRHLSDYVCMRKIAETKDYNLYLVQLVNDNFIVVKVVQDGE